MFCSRLLCPVFFVALVTLGTLGMRALLGARGSAAAVAGAQQAAGQEQPTVQEPAKVPVDPNGPGRVAADDFRAGEVPGTPTRGGRVVVHLETRPKSLNSMLQSSAPVRRVLEEVHARLVERNWETWELEPSLAESWEVEDVVVLAKGASLRTGQVPDRDGASEDLDEQGDASRDGAGEDDSGDAGASEDSDDSGESTRERENAERGNAEGSKESSSQDGAAAFDPVKGISTSQRALAGVLIGRVREDRDAYLVEPLSGAQKPAVVQRVPKSDVERVERAAAFTFHLRKNVRWHDGHPFDARDVVFSLEAYRNPWVQSDHARFRFERIRAFEALDAHTVRVVFDKTYFLALETFEDDFTILPAHVYDLSDPDHPAREPGASPERQGEYVNTHPANTAWIGLGPYRVTAFEDQYIDAERFEGWFDRGSAGYVDSIRWRIVADDGAARQALLAGELDFFARLRSREYLGEFASQEAFAGRFDKGVYYSPQMNYVAWNLRRPLFQDVRVRRALAHAFDWEAFIATLGSGLGRRVTASWYCFSPEYDAGIEPIPFDLERARELLLEAGWFDRDGDGRIDKDGKPFEFQFLYASTDTVAKYVGEALEQNLAQLGIGMELVARDFATRQELVAERDFDAAAMAWILGPTLDPYGHWHSSQAGLRGSGNQPGYSDPESDALIEAIQVELDAGRRRELFHELQARVHDAQPYLFGCVFPTKFAVAKRVRGVQRFLLDPGYSIRRWYVERLDSDR